MEMSVRFSNSNGTFEVSGNSSHVASYVEMFSKVLGTGMSDAEIESIRSGDPLSQVKKEEQKPPGTRKK